jgi:hypothetical protein
MGVFMWPMKIPIRTMTFHVDLVQAVFLLTVNLLFELAIAHPVQVPRLAVQAMFSLEDSVEKFGNDSTR